EAAFPELWILSDGGSDLCGGLYGIVMGRNGKAAWEPCRNRRRNAAVRTRKAQNRLLQSGDSRGSIRLSGMGEAIGTERSKDSRGDAAEKSVSWHPLKRRRWHQNALRLRVSAGIMQW